MYAVMSDSVASHKALQARASSAGPAIGASGDCALAGMVGRRERLTMGGTFAVIRPGLAQFLVEDVRLGELPIPRGAIPKLMRQIRRGTLPPGASENGLPFVVPTYLGDARVSGDNITIYKAAAK